MKNKYLKKEINKLNKLREKNILKDLEKFYENKGKIGVLI